MASRKTITRANKWQTLALTKKPYISVFGPRAITVSGPPSSLSQLRNFRSFEKFSSTGIPIHGPYHSGHLAFPSDVEHILQDLAPQLSALTCRIPIVSSLGDTTLNGDFGTLLADAVRNILIHPIRWPWVIEELRTWLGTPEHTDGASTPFEIVAIASNQVHFLYDSLDRKWPQSTPSPMMVPSRTFGSPHALGESEMDSSYQPKLAIIGMSGRFPSAKDNEAFWNLLYQGLDVSKPVPPLHWNSSTHVDPTGKAKNTSQTPFGCWLDDPAAFDARFFNISPREAIQMDPAQRIALMTAYEAIEQAGIIPDATPSTRRDRVGVYYGVTSNDWMETNSAQDIDTYFIPGGNRAFIPGRINYFFKFSGPSYAVDTACSSSLASIHLACNALWQGQIDMAIAGGTNVLTNPDFTAGLDRGHFLSRTGNCKTFDDDADGYCRGEGIGTVIIKRLDDAIADNDPVLGVILDAQTNHSAEAESITRPHAKAQCFLFRSMLHRSLLDPYDVSYVEMHGTGTQAGDATEMDSVLGSFAPPLDVVKRGRSTNQALYLGSAKSNIGHGEAASGVSSLIKVLLMMQKNIIVPHCGIKSAINRKFPTNLEERNVRITTQPVPWIQTSRASKPRRAFVNNFSAAGGNSALLLEEAPIVQDGPSLNEDTRTVHLVAISAKHPNSLQGNLRSLLETLKQRPNLRLDQLSYTTTVRRVHHPFRVMLAGSRLEEIHDQVEMAIQDGLGMKRAIGIPRLVFMFTGNGAQYPGMGKHLFECFSCFRVEICRLDQIGRSLGFPSILSVIHSDEKDIAVFSPLAVQLATTCIQIALTRLWASWNVLPVAVVGHSLGEYAALNVAGVLSDADVVYLVGRRAQLLEDKCTQGTHSMLVVKSSVESIAAVLTNTKCEVACVNSPIETVIAGPNDEIALFRSLLTDAGMRATLLMVPYAFHSSQVDVIMDPFETIATSVTYAKPQLPILCPLDGSVITSEGKINAQYLSRHCREPVNFRAALTTACREKIVTNDTTTLEIGPHPAMTGMVRAEMPRVASLTSMQRGKPIFQILTATLKTLYCAGADIRWSEYLRDLKASHRVIPLPAYSWDLKDYWMQYVNDWSLRKGDPPQVIAASDGPKLGSTTIHRIVEESHETDKSRIVVEANIAREDLRPLVQGHEVDNVPLCTPSVYADIALSLGTYLLDRIRPNKTERVIDITRMTISKALILRPDIAEQLLQAHADADWNSNSVSIKFMSFSTKNKLQAHAQCLVRFEDHSLQKSLQRHGSELQQQLNRLRDGIATFDTVRFNRSMVYRMIRPLARFHDDYRAIQEVVLNNKTLEASSKLSFSSINSEGIFHTHPAIIDALSQSCGFVMNCKDSTDLDIEVYMNHGWEGFQIFKPIELDKEYTTYTRMHEGVDNLWHGDVAVFEGDDVVASLQQVTVRICYLSALRRYTLTMYRCKAFLARYSRSYYPLRVERSRKSSRVHQRLRHQVLCPRLRRRSRFPDPW